MWFLLFIIEAVFLCKQWGILNNVPSVPKCLEGHTLVVWYVESSVKDS